MAALSHVDLQSGPTQVQNLKYLAFSRLPPLSFSFGRGLQGGAMRRWVSGDEAGARAVFKDRAKACWEAAGGRGWILVPSSANSK